MKTIYKKLLFLLLFLPLSVLAQSTLSGVVTETPSGLPLPGVNVVVQGSTTGASTDFDGKFQLSNVKQGDVIVFSYIGYKETKVTYQNQASLNVSMQEDANELSEVVVVGYGSVRKKDNTGAVSKVSAENLNQGTLTDPLQALQGKAAGVTITKQGGDPNAGFNVRIRGASGFAAGGGPLFVVDGVRGVDPTTIAPEDILSYDILKDAASTAVYGADGANGVIFITTKRGKAGKTSVEYSTYIAMDEVANRIKLVSADRYREFTSANNIAFTDNGANTDWQDEIYRTGVSKNHNFAVSGGNETSNYRASISHMDFDGVIKNSDKQRTVARLNLTQKAFDDKLTVDFGMSQTIERNNYIAYQDNRNVDVLFQAFQRLPTDPVYNPDGTYAESNSVFNYYNPVATLNNIQNERDAKRFAGNLALDYILAKGLNAKVSGSYLRNDSESTYFEPTYSTFYPGQTTATELYRGYGKRSYENWEQSLLEATLTYKATFAESHNLTLLAGYSYRNTGWDGFSAQGRNPLSNQLGADDLQNFEDILLGDSDSYKGERKDIGLFARAMYDYKSKYYITGMIRKDGSSVFGPNNQWGYFPSVQVAWNAANESFIADNIEALNVLKFRGSYGISGNSNIGSYLFQSRVGYSGTGVDPVTGNQTVNFDYLNNANPNLQWDENKEINIGLDFGLFNNRLSGSVEFYQKNLENLLIANNNIPIETNFSSTTYINGGEIENKGIEVTLNANIVKSDNFNWNSTFTYSTNTQKVKALGNGTYDYAFIDVDYISGPGLVGVSTQRMQEGYELGTFFGFEYAGVSNGRWLVNGNDNQLHFLDDVSQSDDHKKVIGNALPDFEMGFSNYFSYKGWDLSLAFRAVVGHDIYNATKMVFGNPDYVGSRNVISEALVLNGTVGGAYQTLDYYLEDGSFIKLDNVNFGYNFRNPIFAKAISNIRIYASANNVFTLTNYSGLDPEVNFSGGNGSNEIYFGTDRYNIYPKTRTFTFGLNVTF